jgi:hypothetical protein
MSTSGPRSIRVLLTLLAVFACAASQSYAQALSVVRSGSFEVGPFAGADFGNGEVHAVVGGNVTYALNKYILPYFEATRFFLPVPAVESGTFTGTGASFVESIPESVYDFHGGVHIRLPIHESPFVPYAAFGVGGLWHPGGSETASYIASGVTYQVPLVVIGHADFAANFGAGVRYYLNQRYGFRVEAKGYKSTAGGPLGLFGKVEVGFFVQLR